MKKIITLLLLLCSLCSVSFANEQKVINSFKAFVADLVAPVEATYGKGYYVILEDSGRFFKANKHSFAYTYDIKESDSIMFPYIGILEVSNKTNFTKTYATEAEARNAFDIDFISEDRQKYIYKYDNGKWIGKVAYYELKGQWKESSDFSLSYFKCKQN